MELHYELFQTKQPPEMLISIGTTIDRFNKLGALFTISSGKWLKYQIDIKKASS